jgi:hypothetical protein
MSLIGKSRRVVAEPIIVPVREEPVREPAKTPEPAART